MAKGLILEVFQTMICTELILLFYCVSSFFVFFLFLDPVLYLSLDLGLELGPDLNLNIDLDLSSSCGLLMPFGHNSLFGECSRLDIAFDIAGDRLLRGSAVRAAQPRAARPWAATQP